MIAQFSLQRLNHRTQLWGKLLLTLTVTLGIISCSGPIVTNSSISGEARNVQNWKLVWANERRWSAASQAYAPPKVREKRHEAFQFMHDYVDQVECILRDKYGFTFIDNRPVSGYIVVDLTPSGFSQPMAVPDTLGERFLKTQMDVSSVINGETTTEAGVGYAVVGALSMLFDNGRCISRVEVYMFAPGGKSMGEIFINGRNSVKPKHVARTLSHLTNTGRK